MADRRRTCYLRLASHPAGQRQDWQGRPQTSGGPSPAPCCRRHALDASTPQRCLPSCCRGRNPSAQRSRRQSSGVASCPLHALCGLRALDLPAHFYCHLQRGVALLCIDSSHDFPGTLNCEVDAVAAGNPPATLNMGDGIEWGVRASIDERVHRAGLWRHPWDVNRVPDGLHEIALAGIPVHEGNVESHAFSFLVRRARMRPAASRVN
ncbi:hypothetical protein CBM2634_A170122 [Cupriavidus taiwanensis]|uniref:Uncharacterized protein n=1 Tax=Cupriavidus taiwanensis TaxID=164546 RepID=A0A375IYA9_9BURK|nr:hypothetical protein CBM2634_A170122 [Cupriavidus taiwanensis]